MAYISSLDMPFVLHVTNVDAAALRPSVMKMIKDRGVMSISGTYVEDGTDALPDPVSGMLVNLGALPVVFVTDGLVNPDKRPVLPTQWTADLVE